MAYNIIFICVSNTSCKVDLIKRSRERNINVALESPYTWFWPLTCVRMWASCEFLFLARSSNYLEKPPLGHQSVGFFSTILLFLCFHMLQRVTEFFCCWAISSCWSKQNIRSTKEAVEDQTCWIENQNLSHCEHPTLLLHAKNRCLSSSS